jgi:hypothetical protein
MQIYLFKNKCIYICTQAMYIKVIIICLNAYNIYVDVHKEANYFKFFF